nr:hypothetical protein KitaXyl93_02430 [Kitasatospora sp. Xyl93]
MATAGAVGAAGAVAVGAARALGTAAGSVVGAAGAAGGGTSGFVPPVPGTWMPSWVPSSAEISASAASDWPAMSRSVCLPPYAA